MNHKALRLPAVLAGVAISLSAAAVDTQIGDVSISNNNRFTLGGAWRVEDRDPSLIGLSNGGTAQSTNGDDSDLAFHRGLAVAAAKLTSDLGVSWGDFGLFARGSYLFDQDLHSRDYFNPANYGAGKSATMVEFQQRTDAVRKHNGNDADLLDAYIYGSFHFADRTLNLKAGRFIINWGESTLVLNGINSYLTADANQLRVPGFELDEVLTPYEQVVMSSNLWDRLNFEAFYQLKWYHTEPDAVGSYFSTDDRAGIAGTRGMLDFGQAPENTPNTTIPRNIPDNEPKNSGQYGIKLDYTFESLNSLDVALYAMQYHSRLPLYSEISKPTFGSPSEGASYFGEYPENIHLYGLSFNTTLPFGGIAMQGEWSLKKDQPLQIDDVELAMTALGAPSQIDPVLGDSLGRKYVRGWRRFDVHQWDVNFTKIFSPSPVYDQLLVLAEVAAIRANLPPASELRFEAPGTYTPGDCTLEALACGNSASPAPYNAPVQQNTASYATPFSWGYRVLARFDYHNVFDTPVGLQPTLLFFHDVKGTTPTPLLNFLEDRKEAGIQMGFKYLENWGGEVGYYNFFGAKGRDGISDRDLVQAILRYTF